MAKKPQIEKFREKARQIEAYLSADQFDEALRKVAKADPDPKDIDNLAEMIGQKEPRKKRP